MFESYMVAGGVHITSVRNRANDRAHGLHVDASLKREPHLLQNHNSLP